MSENNVKVEVTSDDATKDGQKKVVSRKMYVDPVISFINDCFNDFDAADFMKSDIYDDGENYQLEIELPGVDKKDVKLSLEKGYLTVSGKSTSKNKGDKIIRRERYSGQFKRSFYLGEGVLKEDVKANMDNGVLYISVAKAQERKDQEKFIDIQ